MSTAPVALLRETLASPIGTLVVLTDTDGRLRVADFEDYETRTATLLDRGYGRGGWSVAGSAQPSQALRALADYFDGDLTGIDAIETATGGTVLQRAVWTALRAVPAGTTESYGALAARIGHPRAVRPVGAANGANPICIVVPCHRVVGANGTLTGYGGGLERKRWLLDHEARHARVLSAEVDAGSAKESTPQQGPRAVPRRNAEGNGSRMRAQERSADLFGVVRAH